MLTILDVRAALGDIAVGKSDQEIEQIREEFMTLARAVLGVAMSRRAQPVERRSA